MSKQHFHLLAIDGGGTKTLAVVTDDKGSVLGKGKAGASNYQVVGKELALEALVESIEKALLNYRELNEDERLSNFNSLNSRSVQFNKIVFALAGIDTANDQEEVQMIVQKALIRLGISSKMLLVENDCLSALLGATHNKAGALLISGTGSIVFAHDGKGGYFRTGGWGYRVGDEGSGYWIGKEAIRSVLKMNDGREKETILSKLILNKLELPKIDDLYSWVYSPAYCVDDVSSLTTLVEEAHALGDEVSKHILDRAAAELSLLLETTIKKAGIAKEEFQLILQGGVLHNNLYVRNLVLDNLKKKADKVKVMDKEDMPIQFIIRRGLAL